jgi:hypothetical protein
MNSGPQDRCPLVDAENAELFLIINGLPTKSQIKKYIIDLDIIKCDVKCSAKTAHLYLKKYGFASKNEVDDICRGLK